MPIKEPTVEVVDVISREFDFIEDNYNYDYDLDYEDDYEDDYETQEVGPYSYHVMEGDGSFVINSDIGK